MRFLKEKWPLVIAFCIVVVIFFYSFYHPYAGPASIGDPVQSDSVQPSVFGYLGRQGTCQIEILATYQISAAVKSKCSYSADYPAQVSPIDLVLAWGDLNQSAIDRHIRYSQSGRWYYFRFDDDTPVSQSYIQEHSANVHMIPADDRIAAQLGRIRVNDYVVLKGSLVRVRFENGPWTSSLTRLDTGDGACEILYVTNVSIG
jgi:hypothetical protein